MDRRDCVYEWVSSVPIRRSSVCKLVLSVLLDSVRECINRRAPLTPFYTVVVLSRSSERHLIVPVYICIANVSGSRRAVAGV